MKLPLLVEMDGLSALVVGLGRVGRRRARALTEAGCAVTAVDPQTPPADWDPGDIQVLGRDYGMDLLDGRDLVVIATDDVFLNAWVMNDCRICGIPCNRADDPDGSAFIFPSVVRRGLLTLSVCTEGASPGLTRRIADELAGQYGPEYGERTRLLKALRRKILAAGLAPEEKRRKLAELTDCSIGELTKMMGQDK